MGSLVLEIWRFLWSGASIRKVENVWCISFRSSPEDDGNLNSFPRQSTTPRRSEACERKLQTILLALIRYSLEIMETIFSTIQSRIDLVQSTVQMRLHLLKTFHDGVRLFSVFRGQSVWVVLDIIHTSVAVVAAVSVWLSSNLRGGWLPCRWFLIGREEFEERWHLDGVDGWWLSSSWFWSVWEGRRKKVMLEVKRYSKRRSWWLEKWHIAASKTGLGAWMCL